MNAADVRGVVGPQSSGGSAGMGWGGEGLQAEPLGCRNQPAGEQMATTPEPGNDPGAWQRPGFCFFV